MSLQLCFLATHMRINDLAEGIATQMTRLGINTW